MNLSKLSSIATRAHRNVEAAQRKINDAAWRGVRAKQAAERRESIARAQFYLAKARAALAAERYLQAQARAATK